MSLNTEGISMNTLLYVSGTTTLPDNVIFNSTLQPQPKLLLSGTLVVAILHHLLE